LNTRVKLGFAKVTMGGGSPQVPLAQRAPVGKSQHSASALQVEPFALHAAPPAAMQ
jgi:hypothetical protein